MEDALHSCPSPRVKDIVWNVLKRRYGDVGFVRCGEKGRAEEVLPEEEMQRFKGYQQAVDGCLRLITSIEIRDGLVGIYGNSLLRFTFSENQKRALLLLHKAGKDGVAQNMWASQLGIANNNFHYLVKSLEERGLVVRRKVNLKVDKGGVMRNVTTSMVYLSKYAVTAMGDQNGTTVHEPSSSNVVMTQYVNDRMLFENILAELEKMPDHVAVESHLKQDLGYSGVQGHRLWRRIRDRMIQMRLIEQFHGITDDDKTETFLRMLNTLMDVESKSDAVVGPNTIREKPVVRHVGSQIAEMTIDRQIMVRIARQGGAGITSSELLEEQLAVNLKRSGNRMAEIEDRFSCTESPAYTLNTSTVNKQRSILKRYTASRALADYIMKVCHVTLDHDGPPEPPQGGWMQAVTRAAASMPSEKEIEDALKKAGVSMESRGQLEMEQQHEPRIPGENGTGKNDKASHARLVTEIGKARKKWLIEAIYKTGFLLDSECTQILYEAQKAAGDPDPKRPDKKMYMRVAKAAQAEGLIDIKAIELPNQTGTTGYQNHLIFLPPHAPFTNEIYESALEKHQNSFKSHQPLRDLNKIVDLNNLPRMSVQQRKRPIQDSKRNKSNETYKLNLKNGYCAAKLQRCSVLGEAAWRLVEGRSEGTMDSKLEEMLVDDVEKIKGTLYTNQNVPWQRNPNGGITKSHFTELRLGKENKHLIFTNDELWSSLYVEDFLHALGSSCKDQEIIDKFRGKVLGMLIMSLLLLFGHQLNTSIDYFFQVT